MPRPRKDGTPAAAAHKRKLSEIYIRNLKPHERAFCVWDTHQRGLCVLTQPSGFKSWKCVYCFNSRPRWYHLGAVAAIGLADARKLAGKVMFAVAEGKDPLAERQAERSRGTFAELAEQYVEQYAKQHNKSYKQAEALIARHVLPYWGALQAGAITRSDVKAMMARGAPIAANQTLAAASAIFSWAVKEEKLTGINPCKGVDRNPTTERERVLADSEIPKFWAAFDAAGLVQSSALKTILLTGQRPGEVAHMRREHVIDGWWTMPGRPVPELGWPGTKNGEGHRVWLPQPVRDLLAELDGVQTTGFVFTGERGLPLNKLDLAMREACKLVGAERATPHDLRRTFGTMVTGQKHGREAMDRIMNHKEASVGDVYDRADYSADMKRVMETVAGHIMALAEGGGADNVVRLEGRR